MTVKIAPPGRWCCNSRGIDCGCSPFGAKYTISDEADRSTLRRLVKIFSHAMEEKLLAKRKDNGNGAWAWEEWTIEQIADDLIRHVAKGDPVDIANFCAFLWNRLGNDDDARDIRNALHDRMVHWGRRL